MLVYLIIGFLLICIFYKIYIQSNSGEKNSQRMCCDECRVKDKCDKYRLNK